MTTSAGASPERSWASSGEARWSWPLASPTLPRVARLEPVHVRLGEEQALAEKLTRAPPAGAVGRWVDQQLQQGGGAAVARGKLRDDGGEVAARAVARHPEPAGIGTELVGVRSRPAQRAACILHGRRERVLGGQAIVNREHVDARVVAQQATDAIVRVEVAEHEPAAVEEDEQRVRAASFGGRIVAGAQRHTGVDLQVADRADGHGLATEHRRQAPTFAPRVGGRHGVQRPLVTALEQRQHELHLRGKRFAVDADRLASRQPHLDGGRKRGKRACDAVRQALHWRRR